MTVKIFLELKLSDDETRSNHVKCSRLTCTNAREWSAILESTGRAVAVCHLMGWMSAFDTLILPHRQAMLDDGVLTIHLHFLHFLHARR